MSPPDQAQISLASQLLGAVPVVVGGAIGILGGLAAARYGGKLTEAREYRKERREKLEKLVNAAYEMDVWMKREENWVLFGGPDNLEVCPLSTMETVAALHFPALSQEADAFALAVNTYQQWLMTGRTQMTAQNLKTVSQAHLATLNTVYQPFLNARNALIARSKSEMAALNAA